MANCTLEPTCDKEVPHIRIINKTSRDVKGIGWFGDLMPYSSQGVSNSDWEILKQDKHIKTLIAQKTIEIERIRFS